MKEIVDKIRREERPRFIFDLKFSISWFASVQKHA